MIRRLARQAIASFTAWRHARRVARAHPEIEALRQQVADRCRRYRNAEPLRRELRARVIAELAREQGRTIQERRFS
ncbi:MULTISPECIES: hypothetical protein [unclassified Bosea (in: a-proteobacteria)]|uniref:hypothetical protein n=1 Tax=unclassified Bosea (in: a-proteobacteria) TaxID=2653178 RepID=UPI000F755C8F|nr:MULTISPECIES: hypothetical protein [unclassified Bosea (in: a-proteobacteria)]AZO77518.1 hypothetical protein BLM15_07735 [Bosea sp. Tri-49]RXT18126.1 hypothetical protein B5U98_22900 [Bosea sp. Tri-39]RXT32723.1 hypothetical protein B5U99_29245 [Bosea sp. Tri-54]